MNKQLRDYFDQQLEYVLERLPPYVRELLQHVPLIIDDQPTEEVLRQIGSRYRFRLSGLYQGIPLTAQSVEQSGNPPSIIRLFREAIMAEVSNEAGEVTDEALRRLIRIVILHELGHHHGFDEGELEELGY
jgi:predicted Zn-dependent protease with MMP-like domain